MSATPQQLLSFINSSPTPFHLVKEAEVGKQFFEVVKARPEGKQKEKGDVGGKRWRDGWRRTKTMGRRRKGIVWQTKVNNVKS